MDFEKIYDKDDIIAASRVYRVPWVSCFIIFFIFSFQEIFQETK